MKKYRPLILLIILFTAVFAISSFAVAETDGDVKDNSAQTYKTLLPLVTYTESTLHFCRYGINIPKNDADVGAWLPTLGVGHYVNFTTFQSEHIDEDIPLYFQVRVRQEVKDGVYLPKSYVTPPLTMDKNGLGPIVLANPGRVWLVGNEPDVPNSYQDNMMPSTYAWTYRYVYEFIKELDPTAQIANAGLSMFTPGREQYMDIVWDTYLREFGEEMPVDIWNMHLYILSEIRPWDNQNSDGKIALGTDPRLAKRAPYGPYETECPKNDVYCRSEHDDINIFKEQVVAMRQWMKDHGQQNKPLILTEFSTLYPFSDYDDPINPTVCFLQDEFGNCFTQARVRNFMNNTLDFLENANDPALGFPGDGNRLVQQWTWYSTWTNSTGSSSNILLDNFPQFKPGAVGALTQVGHNYVQRIQESDKSINLVAGKATHVTVKAGENGTADVPISLGIYNNGSIDITEPVVVAFFRDEKLHDVIAGKLISPEESGAIRGCSWGYVTHSTTVTWKDLPVGTHTFWVKVDPDNQYPFEISEDDNVLTGKVTVKP